MSSLARKLSMKPQALVKYVKGESMPGGLILIRLHEIGVDINWFLTGEGEMLLQPGYEKVSEPVEEYVDMLGKNSLNREEQEIVKQLISFSEVIKSLKLSPSLQRALLLVYARHIGPEKS